MAKRANVYRVKLTAHLRIDPGSVDAVLAAAQKYKAVIADMEKAGFTVTGSDAGFCSIDVPANPPSQ